VQLAPALQQAALLRLVRCVLHSMQQACWQDKHWAGGGQPGFTGGIA
jgi:hypothetical protein